MFRTKIIGAVLVVLAPVVVGCSDDSAGLAETGLLAALTRVRATSDTRGFVEYGNIARTRELVAVDRRRFLPVHGVGLRNVRSHAEKISAELGFDPLSFREAITAGGEPDWSAIMWGDYDTAAVNDRFAQLGIEQSSSSGAETTWSSSADGDLDVSGPLISIAPPNLLNNVRTAPGSLAFAPKLDSLAWVTDPGGDTLAEDPVIQALAGCLGDVVAATLRLTTEALEPVAVGVRAASAGEVTEVICIAPLERDRANAIRDSAAQALSSGTMPRTARPWSDVLTEPAVEVTGRTIPAVRITAKPPGDAPAGRVLQLLRGGELGELAGR